ncbi:MAG: transporter substrate-binding protein [Burkholderiales bacterium]|nr:transporter substrate-binding protein [Burkholderiales bacterium]
MQRRDFLKLSAAMAGAATLPMSLEAFGAKDPVRVGVLHSLSGTMAISETALKNTALMTFEQINAAGGVLGRPIEPVVVDLASNWPLFAEKARQLITQDKVAAVFGCWTSVSRKSILPVFEELDHHLHEPVMIGEVKADGQFDVVWKTKGPVRAQPWSPFIAGNEPKQDR